jgi:hypothetical protein
MVFFPRSRRKRVGPIDTLDWRLCGVYPVLSVERRRVCAREYNYALRSKGALQKAREFSRGIVHNVG